MGQARHYFLSIDAGKMWLKNKFKNRIDQYNNIATLTLNCLGENLRYITKITFPVVKLF